MSWDAIKGHARVVQTFQAAFARGRLGQGYLFLGPSGVGKHTFAKELAKAVLCESPRVPLEACGQCVNCIMANAATHPDILFAAKPADKNDLPIETVRALCEQLSLKPMRGHGRVAIVDDADDLNESSSNSFLKTLEEPPPHSLLILIGGASADRQLRTIRSRCQLTQFGTLSESDVQAVLNARAEREYEVDAASIAHCGGSPGLALEMAEPTMRKLRERLIEELLRPTVDPFAWADTWLKSLEDFDKENAGKRKASRLLLKAFIELLRLAWAASLGDDRQRPQVVTDLRIRLGSSKLEPLLNRLQLADEQIDRMAQMPFVVETLAMELAG